LQEVVINSTKSEDKVRFLWSYVIWPVSLVALTIILAACFYPFLSNEVAYHFQGETPDKWLPRFTFIIAIIASQGFFTLLAYGMVQLMMLTGRYLTGVNSPLPTLLPIMGNMVMIPQLVLVVAMLDYILYDIYRIMFMPLWIIALVILVLGAIILVILFTCTVRRYRRKIKNDQE